MANTYSAIKRVRQTERRTAYNRRAKSRLRHQIRAMRRAIQEKDSKKAEGLLSATFIVKGRFAYVAGQFCTFRATIGGESVVRCYSMSSSPEAGDRFAVTVKRVPGGKMSNWMNDALAPGDAIEVMPPAGLIVLRETEVPIVAFAGGSGITPVVSIIKTALLATTREIALVYANRGPGSVIFADELERRANLRLLTVRVGQQAGFGELALGVPPHRVVVEVADHPHRPAGLGHGELRGVLDPPEGGLDDDGDRADRPRSAAGDGGTRGVLS